MVVRKMRCAVGFMKRPSPRRAILTKPPYLASMERHGRMAECDEVESKCRACKQNRAPIECRINAVVVVPHVEHDYVGLFYPPETHVRRARPHIRELGHRQPFEHSPPPEGARNVAKLPREVTVPQHLRDRTTAAQVRLARPATFIPSAGLAHTYASASAAALARSIPEQVLCIKREWRGEEAASILLSSLMRAWRLRAQELLRARCLLLE